MHRRRFLAGTVGGAFAGLLGGCMGAGEGTDARRITVGSRLGDENGATNGQRTLTDQGLTLREYGFYSQGSSGGVRGTVENRGTVDLDFIAAHARFFDDSGTQLGTAADTEGSFAVGETWRFTTQLLDTDPDAVARYQLVVIDQRSSEADPFANVTP